VTFPAARVAIRVTGWAPPMDEPVVAAALPGPEWTVLCVSGPDLVARPADLLAEIAAAVGRRSLHPRVIAGRVQERPHVAANAPKRRS
jgi:hypothetical protein